MKCDSLWLPDFFTEENKGLLIKEDGSMWKRLSSDLDSELENIEEVDPNLIPRVIVWLARALKYNQMG